MSRLIVDSPKALGLAMMAGTSERGFRTAGPSPKALGRTATRRPRSVFVSSSGFQLRQRFFSHVARKGFRFGKGVPLSLFGFA
ncbi:hypothetical protein ACTQX9_09580, partial [Collinsella sp. LCP19S3_F2]|uniref:hypothetical protein n=1 Tax=Collinsella sp. LCP19S3_F2 TaxID=3438765 RepID=UPI003F8DB3DA